MYISAIIVIIEIYLCIYNIFLANRSSIHDPWEKDVLENESIGEKKETVRKSKNEAANA